MPSTIPMIDYPDSKKVARAGYDESRQRLAVEFKRFAKDGAAVAPAVTYEYTDTTPAEYAAFLAAESKGAFINATFVKLGRAFEKLPKEEPAQA